CSPVFESEPVGIKSGPFFNLVVSARTDLPLAELSLRLKHIEAGMQMALTLDIAAEAEVDRDQRHPRSISTPTPRAAGTAPG
ncbi:2-amino-4-hydroxy-6-hydroxymethyldihydropteridine diphosphokinase, partial [Pseudomonas aeruginosa]|uniref:2-amino-4-hydroxy-6- hydroxymethyldihydropteridine diphosphokinase n=1 Tax=Pseudomonas aeruginosa TaxID=287 RepID=UPI0039823C16